MEELRLLVQARAGNDSLEGFDPLGQGAVEGDDGAVGAEDDAVPAEAFNHMLDDGAQVFRRVAGGRVIDDAGNLAGDVGQLGQRGEVPAPGGDVTARNQRIAAMIKDEL